MIPFPAWWLLEQILIHSIDTSCKIHDHKMLTFKPIINIPRCFQFNLLTLRLIYDYSSNTWIVTDFFFAWNHTIVINFHCSHFDGGDSIREQNRSRLRYVYNLCTIYNFSQIHDLFQTTFFQEPNCLCQFYCSEFCWVETRVECVEVMSYVYDIIIIIIL